MPCEHEPGDLHGMLDALIPASEWPALHNAVVDHGTVAVFALLLGMAWLVGAAIRHT